MYQVGLSAKNALGRCFHILLQILYNLSYLFIHVISILSKILRCQVNSSGQSCFLCPALLQQRLSGLRVQRPLISSFNSLPQTGLECFYFKTSLIHKGCPNTAVVGEHILMIVSISIILCMHPLCSIATCVSPSDKFLCNCIFRWIFTDVYQIKTISYWKA